MSHWAFPQSARIMTPTATWLKFQRLLKLYLLKTIESKILVVGFGST